MSPEEEAESGEWYRRGLILVPLFLVLLLFNTFFSHAQQRSQTEPDPTTFSFILGNGIRFTAPDSSVAVKFGFRFQNKLTYQQNLDGVTTTPRFGNEIRRLRFKVNAWVFNPKLRFGIHHTLDRGQSRLFIAKTEYRFTDDLTVGFGQFTVDGSRQFKINSNHLATVERSMVDLRFMLFFDQGIYIDYTFRPGNTIVNTHLNITGGEGINTPINTSGYNYVGRVDFLPLGAFKKNGQLVAGDLYYEETFKMAIGGAYAFNNNAVRLDGERGTFLFNDNTDITSIFIDGIFKYRGNSASFLYTRRTNSDFTSVDANNVSIPIFEGSGYLIQAGHIENKKHGIFARFERLLPSHRLSDLFLTDEITTSRTKLLGSYTLFLNGHDLKWQVDAGISFLDQPMADMTHELLVRTQIHINF